MDRRMVRKYMQQWLLRWRAILAFMVALPNRLPLKDFLSRVRLFTRLRDIEDGLDRLTEQADGIAARVDGIERRWKDRKAELDAQERRIAKQIADAERVAGGATVAASDILILLREFVKQATNDTVHYSPRSNRWYGDGGQPIDSRTRLTAHADQSGINADDITTLTYPHTLRECCQWYGTNGYNDSQCPPWFTIEHLCRQLPDDQAESE